MKIAFIKKINESTPYWIKKPFSSFLRKKLIHNRIFLEQYEALQNADKAPEMNALLQLQMLKKTLVHAYEHTIYYRQLFDSVGFQPANIKDKSDLKVIPVLTKKTIETHYLELAADDISDYYEVSTGGTTGKPTIVLMDRDAIYREWAFIYHYWSKFGYNFHCSRLATLRGVDLHGKKYEINPLYQEIRLNPFIMSSKNIRTYVKHLEDFGADFIYGYPSSIYNFCRLCEEQRIAISNQFKAAFLISENLYAFQEEMIKRVLNCPVSIFYGHSERALFAEYFVSGYVFNPLYGITEISKHGRPIVTGLINPKMPLIRYEVDDFVELGPDGTYSICGHYNSEVLYGENGEQVSMAAINFHDDTFKRVETYQFFQEVPGKSILRVIEMERLSGEDIRKIKRRVENKLGEGIKITVEVVDQIELTKRGKYKMLIQKYYPTNGFEA